MTAVEEIKDLIQADHLVNGRLRLAYVMQVLNKALEKEAEQKSLEKQRAIDFARHCLEKVKDLDTLTAFMNVEEYYDKYNRL